MPSKKLLTLLEDFSGYDLNRFRRYLASPYFNENEELVQLFDLLNETIRNEALQKNGDHATAKKQLWRQIFGRKAYNDAHMRRLISELIRHTLSFLALERWQQQPTEAQLHLLPLLEDPKYDLHFAGVVRQIEGFQEKSNLRDIPFHYKKFLLEERQYQQIEKADRSPEMLKKLELADYHFNCHYISQKLKHYCEALGYGNFLSTEVQIDFPTNFLNWVEQSAYLQEVSVRVYFLISKMLLQPTEESFFQQLKSLLAKEGHCFGRVELKSLYIHLMNYCIDTKINVGRTEYFAQLFEIFRTLLERDILLENGVLAPQDYKNIITVGLQVKEFDWVENFIRSYTEKLPPADQENAKTYNLAKVFFQQAQYDKVIEQLREVEYQNLNYALGGKLMLLKTYYELNEYLALDSLADSFRIYLRRNKLISKDVRQQYLNVLRFVKKLSNIRPGDEAALAKMRRQINDCKALADKSWILQKLAELEK